MKWLRRQLSLGSSKINMSMPQEVRAACIFDCIQNREIFFLHSFCCLVEIAGLSLFD